MFAAAPNGVAGWRSTHRLNISALPTALPPNVHLTTVQPLSGGRVLLRVDHMYEAAAVVPAPDSLGAPVNLSLSALFFDWLHVSSAVEMTLTANQPLAERMADTDAVRPADLPVEDRTHLHALPADAYTVSGDDFTITLYPMQIRTFMLS
jgi:hypothetical protein